MAEEKVLLVDVEDEMRKSYIDYAMSVIVGRALPDVRDGLKPVHRRILYSMYELGLTPDKPYRKSARIVGDVLGKYHPHGDAAVYDAMVRLAQDFSTRYMLIDGHGNFGSVDGDAPAAMRYTEARLSKISIEMLRDIEKDTVDFIPNFDNTTKEPSVLPSRFPNLLVNGSSGIAVGMATNIPPHNLAEVIDCINAYIDNSEIDINELIKIIEGPDFPTGGLILGRDGIKESYLTGKGRIIVRAKASIEEMSGGRSRIVITEIPYQVNKANLVEKIAELVKNKKLEGISDLRDESDRSGMRIVIELKRDVNPNVVLNYLYKHTQLQETFGVIMLALVDGEPKILNLKEIIKLYVDYQKEIVIRRTKFDLDKAENRAHILEGLKIALDNIDEVINLIRSSKSVQEAKSALMERFGLSEKQAQAILDMRLQRLTGLEREKIDLEYKELLETIKYLKFILENEREVLNIIKKELLEIKEKFKDERRTKILNKAEEIDIEDTIQKEDVVITLTHMGYIRRLPLDMYRSQRRGGKGLTGAVAKEEDFVVDICITTTHDNILFLSNKGNAYRLKAYEIPEVTRYAKGTAIINLLPLKPGEKITNIIPVKDFTENKYLVMITKLGMIKRSELAEYNKSKKSGIRAIDLLDEDELVSVKLTDGNGDLIVGTANGYCIRFNEEEVRVTGRVSKGVKAIELREGDFVVGMDILTGREYILTVTEKGYGKKTDISEYRMQSRGGKGIIACNVNERTGNLVSIKAINEEDEIMVITAKGNIIRCKNSEVSKSGRNTRGSLLIKLDEGDTIVGVGKIEER